MTTTTAEKLPRVGALVRGKYGYSAMLFSTTTKSNGVRPMKRAVALGETFLVVNNVPGAVKSFIWTVVIAADGLAYIDPSYVEEVTR